MIFVYLVFVVWCLGLLAAGIVEQRNHRVNLRAIPARILVNGIRGKSSITRLCAGALRGGGQVVVGKTTGTAARFIYPDASEEPVYRKFGLANVIEQVAIVRRATAFHPDALVIECMAVTPALQEINETKLIQSTIGIICNVRADHLAEMGPTLEHVARSLSRSIPVGGVCVTAEKEHIEVLREEARRRRCRLIEVNPESVTDHEMAGFGWITFKENVAIALAVAQLHGVRRRDALAGMWTAPPDPGVLRVQEILVGGRHLKLANVFAANDPESTLMNVRSLQRQRAIARPLHMIINCRPDRIERNGQMGSLTEAIDPDRVILIGEPTRSARATIPPAYQSRVIDLGGRRPPAHILRQIVRGVDRFASLITVGNIHGQGELLLAEFERYEAPPAAIRTMPRQLRWREHMLRVGRPW
jgi:poly-gamma-glutamate synthase PgsB/CapB